MVRLNGLVRGLVISVCIALPAAVVALEDVEFQLAREDDDLLEQLRNTSALEAALEDERATGRDFFAAALSDYGRLLDALYANGYYGPVINIYVNGREAADTPLLSVPNDVNSVRVVIDQGGLYRFSRTELTPLPPDTELPEDFRINGRARSGTVGAALTAGISSWRDAGYAKASLADQSVVANHAARRLAVDMSINPGPLVRFGAMRRVGNSAVRGAVVRRVAAIPTGARFSPQTLRDAEQRLRRTGAFSSVSLDEGETVGPDGSMDILIRTVDAKPRRFGFGAEISSLEGGKLSSFWLHRNLFGGAERLRLDAEVTNIGSSESGLDYSLGARFEVPAVLGANTDGFLSFELAHLDEPTFISDRVELGLGLTRIYSPSLTAEAGVSFLYSETQDDLGDRTFTLLTFPVSATLDERDNELNATEGYYLDASIRPYIGLGGSQSGARMTADARYYLPIVEDNSQIVAARLQIGSVLGSDLEETLPEYLFTSGGGGTVRGQPYQSLDIDLGEGDNTGGRSFVGVSTEYRTKLGALGGNLSAVAFYDAGYIGEASFYDGSGNWHSGAGLGLRYNTGIGPIRLDIAGPVSGDTGDGVQFYIGIGQAF